MDELVNIKNATLPDNILLVCDSMMGQDAVTTAKGFDKRLNLDGVIMTKLDGDARGGAALSIKHVLNKPLKYLGMGEDLGRLEEFRPEGLASRILGQGDVVGLMQDFSRVADKEAEEETAVRMLQGQFTLRDFYSQIEMIQKMGPLKDILAKMPMQDMIPKDAVVDDRELVKIKAMIDSMTEKERVKPELLNAGRVRRIAKGSGRPEKEVQELIKKFSGMRKVMGMFGKNMGLMGKIPGLGGLAQMNQMRKMTQNLGSQGLGGMSSLFGGMGEGAGAFASTKKPIDRDKQKKLRKQARKARQKNRKK
jgi:signal recognition particle subunit SRP54